MSVDIHMLNVGHGDCTFVDFEGEYLTMIDINTSKSLREGDVAGLAEAKGLSSQEFKTLPLVSGRTWEDVYRSILVGPLEYYRSHFDGRPIFRYIQTHPDMDHMTGLHAFFWQTGVEVLNMWDLDHARVKSEEDFDNPGSGDYYDWLMYELMRSGKHREGEHKVLNLLRGRVGSYWSDNGITIMSPTAELVTACSKVARYNNASYVVRVDYAGRRVILPGDVEGIAQADMLDALGEDGLKCDVLKAPHHGRQSGYHEAAAEAMDPDVVVCSVGKKPETDATDEWARLGAKVFSTRYQGTITVQMWFDGEVWVKNRKGERIHTLPPLRQRV
jgi:competence protein ComEC